MREHHIPGLSLTIILDGKIARQQGYGFTDTTCINPVTPDTLFQAGSISKAVAAFGALRLVQEGKLSLDADVNTQLRTWKVPENQFTKDRKVTLRSILSHTAGLTVHGFPGYAVDAPLPTLVQILDGVKPANTSPVRVDFLPGSKWRYSGGGYTVMQQLLLDVTCQPFPDLMRDTVLKPLGMTNSTFQQPLPQNLAPLTASGYFADDKPVKGRWHIYPEMAAAGLWTTPADLARFAIAIQQSLAGETNPVLSQSMTRTMLTHQKNDDLLGAFRLLVLSHKGGDGLGLFLDGSDKKLRFSHTGRDAGFDASLLACAATGKGAVIMINANDHSGTIDEILAAIAKKYDW
jgi:CubicO group peptidase (beta-lactamase class C family)